MQRYVRLLEESSGRSPARFSWIMLLAAVGILILAPFVGLEFLGTPLNNVMVYLWSRRNPNVLMSLFGLVTFKAPYMPWIMLSIHMVMSSMVPKDDLVGIFVGHGKFFCCGGIPLVH